MSHNDKEIKESIDQHKPLKQITTVHQYNFLKTLAHNIFQLSIKMDLPLLTSTINTYFGSVSLEKDGVVLNNQMDDFVAQPGIANAYGLIGSEANYVAPYGIPLSSMTPTIIIPPMGQRYN